MFRVDLASGISTDVTPFDRDVPPLALGGRDVSVLPTGTEVAIVYNPDSALATSTNNDVFVMGPDGSAKQAITTSAGNDNSPLYSPDGRYLAYLAMATPGFESDRRQLMVYERASGRRIQVSTEVGVEHLGLSLVPGQPGGAGGGGGAGRHVAIPGGGARRSDHPPGDRRDEHRPTGLLPGRRHRVSPFDGRSPAGGLDRRYRRQGRPAAHPGQRHPTAGL